MGGTTDAKEVVYSAIKKGKDVVTANKALIAACLPEIESLLHNVNSKDGKAVEFRYEAAVCGGIPIIRSMQRILCLPPWTRNNKRTKMLWRKLQD